MKIDTEAILFAERAKIIPNLQNTKMVGRSKYDK